MAIYEYEGLMGRCKSYEVVSIAILHAIQVGRTVVINIDGINPQTIEDYILARTKLTVEVLTFVISPSGIPYVVRRLPIIGQG
jgi:zona occludens toxin (predicted ATPase)